MANNIFTGNNLRIAKVGDATGPGVVNLADLFATGNTEVVFLADGNYYPFNPSVPIGFNPITKLEKDKGYLIISKSNRDLTDYFY